MIEQVPAQSLKRGWKREREGGNLHKISRNRKIFDNCKTQRPYVSEFHYIQHGKEGTPPVNRPGTFAEKKPV